MKANRRTRRALRALALAGCTSALVLPATAGARPIEGVGTAIAAFVGLGPGL